LLLPNGLFALKLVEAALQSSLTLRDPDQIGAQKDPDDRIGDTEEPEVVQLQELSSAETCDSSRASLTRKDKISAYRAVNTPTMKISVASISKGSWGLDSGLMTVGSG
jgi:hypothetical protein